MYRNRGGNRGYAGRGYKSVAAKTPASSASLLPMGSLQHRINLDAVKELVQPQESPTIVDCRYLASYNWIHNKTASIVVPGAPPKWSPPSSTPKLEQDDGEFFRDINAANYPKHSLEPALTAVLAQSEEVAGQADIFACGSTLGNLLQFASSRDKTFRFIVEMVGDTVFLVRRENHPRETISDIRGYGHTFPEAYTKLDPSVQGSSTHQRLISYDFAGLEFVVRFESDGYFGDLSDDTTEPFVASSNIDGLSIVSGGRIIPQEALFDLKTRSMWDFETRRVRKRSDKILEQEIPRLWIKQIPKMIVAYHTFGTFNDIDVIDVQDRVDEFEKKHAAELGAFAQILKQIIAHARRQSGQAFEVCSQEQGELEFRDVGGDWSSALSDGLKAKWSAEAAGPGDSESSETYEADADGDSDGVSSVESDESARDYTACDTMCGYCGRCKY